MNLFLIRGLPGAGKTEFANSICDLVCSADDYFYDKDGNYNFDASKLKKAHESCRDAVENAMCLNWNIAVANTFTQEWEMKPYYDLAKFYGYRVYSIVIENRHGNESVHDVPKETIDKMRNRFEVKL